MPVMVVIGQLTEKLQSIIEGDIITQLQQTNLLSAAPVSDQNKTPQCTFIFDREAYEPAFFIRLWETYRIAVITYRKNVKDKWDQNTFKSVDVTVLNQAVTMLLCEQKIELGGFSFREKRRLGKDGHQTAIITTHPSIDIGVVAGRMFGRWSQENFFRYLIQDYDFDKMIEFGTQTLDTEQKAVNPNYRQINHQIKKAREKIKRLEAKFFPLFKQVMEENIDQIPALTQKQSEYKTMLEKLKQDEKELMEARSKCEPKITLCQMPEQTRYNQLKTEGKMLMNVIKMICYRAESSLVSLSAPYLNRVGEEGRMLIKQIIANNADLKPDYKNKTLTITLHSLSAPRFNKAASEIATILNQT